MDRQTLDFFCRQLAHWAEGAIENGRLPFRRAETFSPLLTAAGEIAPPLTLWINRDSCMAGGILFFPSHCPEESVEEGRACAQALGLRHFVTWAPREIVIWEERDGKAVRHRILPTPAAEVGSPAIFCDIFRTLLEEIKPLSIAGAITPAELSPFYLANLCRLTLRAITPFLAEAFRIARRESLGKESIPSAAARQQAHLLLLRLLTLLLEDRMPPVIEAEGFDRALCFALDSLPQTLRRSLDIQRWEIPLPPAGAVRLQHLNRRLTQLRIAENRPRWRQVLDIHLRNAAAELGGAPLPPVPQEITGGALLLNPDRCYPSAEVVTEIASPPFLAYTALLRHLRGDSPVLQAAHPSALDEMPTLAIIQGFLPAGDPPDSQERRSLTARLRLSWPNRRFQIPIESPRWVYEFLHLLGLAREGSHIALDIPSDWLTASYGVLIFGILTEHFSLSRLERRPEGLRIHLQKGNDAVEITIFIGPGGKRPIPWAQLRGEPLSFLPLALDLPDALFALLRQHALQTPKNWPTNQERGIYLFSRSSLGRTLWNIVAGGRSYPARSALSAHLRRHAFPLPGDGILQALQKVFDDQQNEPVRSAVDRELANWLGIDRTVVADGCASKRKLFRRTATVTEDLIDQIRRTVFTDGLPRFPEQYLYNYYRPELIAYRLAGPLTLSEEFFGQQRLVDQEGNTLTVEGNETARALLLASYSGESPIFLPADRHLTARIVEQYLGSLRELQRGLIRESHRLLTDGRMADSVANRIWERLSLPPWPLIAS